MNVFRRLEHGWHRLAPVAIASLLLGLFGYWQFDQRAQIQSATTSESQEVLAIEVSRLITTNDGLRTQLADLTQREYALASALTDRQSAEKSLSERQQQAQILNGTTGVTGPGVKIYVGQTLTISQQTDILNALNNIGAEAIAVAGRRVTWTYSPWNVQPAAPFTIEAIGSPAALASALTRRGGVIDQLESTTGLLDVRVEQSDALTLASGQSQDIVFGRAVEQ